MEAISRYAIKSIVLATLLCHSASCWYWYRPWYPSDIITTAVVANYDSRVGQLRREIEELKKEKETCNRNEDLKDIATDIKKIKESLQSGKPNDDAKPRAKELEKNLEQLERSVKRLREETE
ncbi:hypothetical protein KAU11_01710 [Candidatus Babeliales bacterium]|nr:hypothetical protein [Candidatus Babeliales bacterium]